MTGNMRSNDFTRVDFVPDVLTMNLHMLWRFALSFNAEVAVIGHAASLLECRFIGVSQGYLQDPHL